MTSIAEVGGAEAEEDSDGAAVPALVLKEVSTVLGAHLGTGDIRARPAHQLPGVVLIPQSSLHVTSCLSTVVSLEEGWSG